jgi:hypothetical protein
MSRYSRRSIAVPPFRLAAGLAAALAGTVLLGPAPAAPEPDVTSPIRPAKVAAADAESVSFGELFRKGGPLMYPLAAMSILAVAFATTCAATSSRTSAAARFAKRAPPAAKGPAR